MTVQTTVPADLLEPNTFQEFDITSGSRGLVPFKRRVALIGAMADFASADPNVPFQVFTSREVADACGQGSEIHMMALAKFKADKKYGSAAETWICPIVDPDGGTKATYTITFTGSASESGTLDLEIQGQPIGVGLASGDSADTQASKTQKRLKTLAATFAFVATVASNVVTLTLVNAGVNGNKLVGKVKSAPAGVGAVWAAGVAGAGDADPGPALDALVDKIYNTVVLANSKSGDLDDLASHIASVNAPAVKRFSKGVIANVGNLSSGTTLSTHINAMEIVVVNAYGSPRLPGEIAAQVGATIEAESDPSRSFDNVELALEPAAAALVPDSGPGSTVETALSLGLCILGANNDNSKMRLIRLVTTKASQGSAPFYDVLDISNVRTLHYTALQVDAAWQRAFPRAKASERTREAVYSNTLATLREVEKAGFIQNVDALKDQLIVEPDSVNKNRFNVEIPVGVIPNLHQLVGVNKLILSLT